MSGDSVIDVLIGITMKVVIEWSISLEGILNSDDEFDYGYLLVCHSEVKCPYCNKSSAVSGSKSHIKKSNPGKTTKRFTHVGLSSDCCYWSNLIQVISKFGIVNQIHD